MAGFDLSNYKTVPERIAEAKALYPDGRFQSRIVSLPEAFADKFVAVEAMFYRTADDPTPASGLAWESVPGKTPYTKDSELMNAETSAWGRALIAAFAADASKGIASREEVQNRQPEPRPRSGGKRVTPSPQVPESHVKAPQTNEKADVVAEVKRMKNWALTQLGDVDKAKAVWEKVISTYELNPTGLPNFESLQFIESDLSIAVGEALTEALVKP